MLNPAEIQKQYPKAWKKLKDWIIEGQKKLRDNAYASLSDIEKEIVVFPDIIDVKDEEIGAMVIWYNRRLYDFFDEQEIYIKIGNILHPEDGRKWQATFDGKFPDAGKTREEAEKNGFTNAFEILEGKL